MITSPYTQAFTDLTAKLPGVRQFARGEDTWVVTDNETQFILRGADGSWVLTRQSRGGPEWFQLSSPDIADIERYLTDVYGSDLRGLLRLPVIVGGGSAPDDASPEYRLTEVSPKKVALVRRDGTVRAVLSGNLGSSADKAVWFSWIIDAPLADLRASYLDPDGLPMFPGLTICQTHRQSKQ